MLDDLVRFLVSQVGPRLPPVVLFSVPLTHISALLIYCPRSSFSKRLKFPLSGGRRHTVLQVLAWALWGLSLLIASPLYLDTLAGGVEGLVLSPRGHRITPQHLAPLHNPSLPPISEENLAYPQACAPHLSCPGDGSLPIPLDASVFPGVRLGPNLASVASFASRLFGVPARVLLRLARVSSIAGLCRPLGGGYGVCESVDGAAFHGSTATPPSVGGGEWVGADSALPPVLGPPRSFIRSLLMLTQARDYALVLSGASAVGGLLGELFMLKALLVYREEPAARPGARRAAGARGSQPGGNVKGKGKGSGEVRAQGEMEEDQESSPDLSRDTSAGGGGGDDRCQSGGARRKDGKNGKYFTSSSLTSSPSSAVVVTRLDLVASGVRKVDPQSDTCATRVPVEARVSSPALPAPPGLPQEQGAGHRRLPTKGQGSLNGGHNHDDGGNDHIITTGITDSNKVTMTCPLENKVCRDGDPMPMAGGAEEGRGTGGQAARSKFRQENVAAARRPSPSRAGRGVGREKGGRTRPPALPQGASVLHSPPANRQPTEVLDRAKPKQASRSGNVSTSLDGSRYCTSTVGDAGGVGVAYPSAPTPDPDPIAAEGADVAPPSRGAGPDLPRALPPWLASAIVILMGAALATTAFVLLLAIEYLPDNWSRILYCGLAFSCIATGVSSTYGLGGHLRYRQYPQIQGRIQSRFYNPVESMAETPHTDGDVVAVSADDCSLRLPPPRRQRVKATKSKAERKSGKTSGPAVLAFPSSVLEDGRSLVGSVSSLLQTCEMDVDLRTDLDLMDRPEESMDCWRFFQPFAGGTLFVATQAVGWCLFSLTLLSLLGLARAILGGVGHCLRCWVLGTGSLMMASQIVLGVSLLLWEGRTSRVMSRILSGPRTPSASFSEEVRKDDALKPPSGSKGTPHAHLHSPAEEDKASIIPRATAAAAATHTHTKASLFARPFLPLALPRARAPKPLGPLAGRLAQRVHLCVPLLLLFLPMHVVLGLNGALFLVLPPWPAAGALVGAVMLYYANVLRGSPAHRGGRRWPALCDYFTAHIEDSLGWWCGECVTVRPGLGLGSGMNPKGRNGHGAPEAAEAVTDVTTQSADPGKRIGRDEDEEKALGDGSRDSVSDLPGCEGSEDGVESKYVFGFHPHGLYPVGAGNVPLMPSFRASYPDVHPVTLTASVVHYVPGICDIARWAGFRQVSRSSFQRALHEAGSVLVCPGGQAEMTFAHRACDPREATMVVYAGHKGFVRLALEAGASLVPVLALGELQALAGGWCSGPLVERLQRWTYKCFGAPFPFWISGRWWVTMLPRRVPLRYVVGEPIPPPPGLEKGVPVPAQVVDEQHARFYAQMRQLWDENHLSHTASRHLRLVILHSDKGPVDLDLVRKPA